MRGNTTKLAFSIVKGFSIKSTVQPIPAICRSSSINAVAATVGSCRQCVKMIAVPSHHAFDKVPKNLPDWWDDEDDEEGDEKEKQVSMKEKDLGKMFQLKNDGGDGGSSGGNGSGGNGGSGGDENNDDENTNFFSRMLLWYTSLLTKFPIPTKSISTSVLAIFGDLLAQYLAHKIDHNSSSSSSSSNHGMFKLDQSRTIGIGIWGLLFMGPVLHGWYSVLNYFIVGQYSVFKKVVIDQIVFAPFFNTAFMFGTGMLEGKSFSSVNQVWKSKFKESMFANWMIWPIAQAINFTFIPKPYQVIFVNIVALFWNAILTYISHDDEEQSEQKLASVTNMERAY